MKENERKLEIASIRKDGKKVIWSICPLNATTTDFATKKEAIECLRKYYTKEECIKNEIYLQKFIYIDDEFVPEDEFSMGDPAFKYCK